MTWYAAHIITYVQLLTPGQKQYPVRENVILIGTKTVDDAYLEAEKIGRANFEESEVESTTLWNDQPARWVFGGVRKLVECHNVPSKGTKWDLDVPEHGTEITFSNFFIENEQDLEKIINNESVKVLYEE